MVSMGRISASFIRFAPPSPVEAGNNAPLQMPFVGSKYK